MQANRRLRHPLLAALVLVALALSGMGCNRRADRPKAVFVLMDPAAFAADKLNPAESVVNCLLANLASPDHLAAARIDAGRFGKQRHSADVTFDGRPTIMAAQKRVFQKRIADMAASEDTERPADIYGGLLQAVQHLNHVRRAQKFIIVLSNLNALPAEAGMKDVPIHLEGINVIALAIARPGGGGGDTEIFRQWMGCWRRLTESGGGIWLAVDDLTQLDRIFKTNDRTS